MKRKRVLLLLCILSCTLQLFAQQINVQGIVYDPSGETVPGALITPVAGRIHIEVCQVALAVSR